MKYVTLGKTGLRVSALSFGVMTFGGETDEREAETLYRQCREQGVNFFDCANVYNEGKAEQLLGKFIRGERNEVIISSKAYFPTGPDVNARGLSRRHIFQAVEASLKRLNTEYIDLYFMHRFDENVPLEESLRALKDLVAQGKILYLGASNFAAWQIMKAIGISTKRHWPEIDVIQPMYNLLKRQAESEIFPLALSEKLGVLIYNPLAGGMLTGKYAFRNGVVSGRLYEKKIYALRYSSPAYAESVERFISLATKIGVSPAGLAIAWAASHPAVSSPLLGARNLEQLKDCLKAQNIEMTNALRQEINALTPTPPLATDRSDEWTSDPLQAFPVRDNK